MTSKKFSLLQLFTSQSPCTWNLNAISVIPLGQARSTRSLGSTCCPLNNVILPAETFEMRKSFNPFPDKADTESRMNFEYL